MTSNKKSSELQSCINFLDLQLLFWSFVHLRSFSITTHMTIEHMDSFGINSIQSCESNIQHQNDFNENAVNNKVVDLIEYYNFGIKFVLLKHNMRKL